VYPGSQFFPTTTPGYGSTMPTTTQGITIDQYAAIEMMKGLLANANNLPATYEEMAQQAKRAAMALIIVL
jgi:hypothetical protein